MIRGEVEFLADSLLIEKLAWIDASINGVHKEAGIGDTLMGMLDSGLTRIKDSVSGSLSHLVDTSDTSSVIESVAKMISSGALFTLWPPLGIINAVASEFGLDIVSIGKKIWNMISGSLSNNGSVTPQEVSEATKAVTSQIAGSPSDQKPVGTDTNQILDSRAAMARWDLLEPLRTLEKRGELYKIAILGGLFNWFFSLPIFKAKGLIGGLIGWAIKGALIGAGLMAGAGTVTRLVGLKKDEPKPTENAAGAGSEGEAVTSNYPQQPSTPSPKLTATGRGEQRHPNTPEIQWYVPVVGGSIERTLLTWAKDIYTEFSNSNVESLIRSCPGFQRAAEELSNALEFTSNQIKVPNQYKTRKQIVDMFAGQAAAKLN